ncbi:MAG: carbohydrate kinase family protein [Ruminococcaceae bacterium]|nr:carbohydrate kinase family protein [Oscillospiraceae bacterium]
MSKILVCGLVNMETTVKVKSFPLEYIPIDYNFFGVNSYPAGVGLNLSLAFSSLSDEVKLLSMVGDDSAGEMVKSVLTKNNVSIDYLCDSGNTAQSVVLYDDSGRRRIFCDLKDFQQKSFDEELFEKAAQDCDTLCLCNINFSRNLLKLGKSMGKRIACDVHTLSDIDDEYNFDYMNSADILFLSNENIVDREDVFLNLLKDKFRSEIIVIGMGKKGSLMYVRADEKIYHCDAVYNDNVVNTVGAGDALFSSFVHFYTKGIDPYLSLMYASAFASYKISFDGAAKGFLSTDELLDFYKNLDK